MHAFDEIDGCLEFCRSAVDEQQTPGVFEAYFKVASSKIDNASMLMDLAGKTVDDQDGDEAWAVLREIVDGRIRSARATLSTLKR